MLWTGDVPLPPGYRWPSGPNPETHPGGRWVGEEGGLGRYYVPPGRGSNPNPGTPSPPATSPPSGDGIPRDGESPVGPDGREIDPPLNTPGADDGWFAKLTSADWWLYGDDGKFFGVDPENITPRSVIASITETIGDGFENIFGGTLNRVLILIALFVLILFLLYKSGAIGAVVKTVT